MHTRRCAYGINQFMTLGFNSTLPALGLAKSDSKRKSGELQSSAGLNPGCKINGQAFGTDAGLITFSVGKER